MEKSSSRTRIKHLGSATLRKYQFIMLDIFRQVIKVILKATILTGY
jgi:hypothetical protein